jgi:ATP-binding cassette, subfamily A (ABC1), member 3
MRATTFSLDLIFPIGNVFRALVIGLNIFVVTCQDNHLISYPGSIYAYGGPILYLCIQVFFLAFLLVWLDRGSWPEMLQTHPVQEVDGEMGGGSTADPEVLQEKERVEASSADLLRMLHVSKAFGSNLAIDNVSLGLGEGEVLGLLGTNGAGKTTIVNMIRGELRPSSGKILVRGVDVHAHTREAQRHMGVCPQFDALDLLTARQHLEFYATAKGLSNVASEVDIVLAKVGLTPFASRLANKLSGGNKRKLSLAIALLGNPDVLLLDEPSSAMDVVAKRAMWKTLAEIAPGRSILLTTHSMEEADALATRVAILSKHLLAIGGTQALRQRYSNFYHVQIILRSAPTSTPEEMLSVERWVVQEIPNAFSEGENLGGQIKISIPASAVASSEHSDIQGRQSDIVNVGASGTRTKSAVVGLIEKLESHKEELGISHYSVGATTLEQVFLNVARENNVQEEDGETKQRWHWW